MNDLSFHFFNVPQGHSDYPGAEEAVSPHEMENVSPTGTGGHYIQNVTNPTPQRLSLQLPEPPSIAQTSHSIEVATRETLAIPDLLAERTEALKNCAKELSLAMVRAEKNFSLAPSLRSQAGNISNYPNQAAEKLIRAAFDKVTEEQKSPLRQAKLRQAKQEIDAANLLAKKLDSIGQKNNGIPSRSLPTQERKELEAYIERVDKQQATLQSLTVDIQGTEATHSSAYVAHLTQAAEQALKEAVVEIDKVETQHPDDKGTITKLQKPVSIAVKVTTIALNAAQIALAEAIIIRGTLFSSEQELETTMVRALEDHIAKAADLVTALSIVQQGAENTLRSLYNSWHKPLNVKRFFRNDSYDLSTQYINIHYGCRLHSFISPPLSELAQQSYRSAVEMSHSVPFNEPQIVENQKFFYQKAKIDSNLNRMIQFPLITDFGFDCQVETKEVFKRLYDLPKTAQKAYQDQIEFYFLNHPNLFQKWLSSAPLLVKDDVATEMKQALDYSRRSEFHAYDAIFPTDFSHFHLFYLANIMGNLASQSVKPLSSHQENNHMAPLEICLAKRIVVATVKAAGPIIEKSAIYEKRYKLKANVTRSRNSLIKSSEQLKNSIEEVNKIGSDDKIGSDKEEVEDLKILESFIEKIKACATDFKISQIAESRDNLPEPTKLDHADLFNWIKSVTSNQTEFRSIVVAAQQALPALIRCGCNGAVHLLYLRAVNTNSMVQEDCFRRIKDRFSPMKELLTSFAYAAQIDIMDEQKIVFDKLVTIANNAVQASNNLISKENFCREYRFFQLEPALARNNNLKNIQLQTTRAYTLARDAMNAYDSVYNASFMTKAKLRLLCKDMNPKFEKDRDTTQRQSITALNIFKLKYLDDETVHDSAVDRLNKELDQIIVESTTTLQEVKAIKLG